MDPDTLGALIMLGIFLAFILILVLILAVAA